MTCSTCGQPITLLNSQKNGNLETCLPCALQAAPFVRYTLKRRTELIDDVVLCQQHYRDDKDVLLHPLTDREIKAGMTQAVLPYSGIYGCRTCNEQHVSIDEVVARR